MVKGTAVSLAPATDVTAYRVGKDLVHQRLQALQLPGRRIGGPGDDRRATGASRSTTWAATTWAAGARAAKQGGSTVTRRASAPACQRLPAGGTASSGACASGFCSWWPVQSAGPRPGSCSGVAATIPYAARPRRGAPAGTIRVVVADDQPLLRTGFKALIQSVLDLEVVGEAGDGREAVRLGEGRPGHVVLMDIRMPVLDGLAATLADHRDADPAQVRVLILTTFEIDEYVFEALGALGPAGSSATAWRPTSCSRSALSAAATRSVPLPRPGASSAGSSPRRAAPPVDASCAPRPGCAGPDRELELPARCREQRRPRDQNFRPAPGRPAPQILEDWAMAKVGARRPRPAGRLRAPDEPRPFMTGKPGFREPMPR